VTKRPSQSKSSDADFPYPCRNEVTDETSIQIYHERAMWDLLRIFFVDAAYQPCLSQVFPLSSLSCILYHSN